MQSLPVGKPQCPWVQLVPPGQSAGDPQATPAPPHVPFVQWFEQHSASKEHCVAGGAQSHTSVWTP